MLHTFTPRWPLLAAAVSLVAALAAVAQSAWATEQKTAVQASEVTSKQEPVKASVIQAKDGAEGEAAKTTFTEEFLNDEKNVAAGKALWQKQCRHCHGKSAYPGKAPKLKPRKYTAEFVYERVTNGFRKMPPWKAVFSDEERMAITAFVMSKKFSP